MSKEIPFTNGVIYGKDAKGHTHITTGLIGAMVMEHPATCPATGQVRYTSVVEAANSKPVNPDRTRFIQQCSHCHGWHVSLDRRAHFKR